MMVGLPGMMVSNNDNRNLPFQVSVFRYQPFVFGDVFESVPPLCQTGTLEQNENIKNKKSLVLQIPCQGVFRYPTPPPKPLATRTGTQIRYIVEPPPGERL